MPAAGQLCQQFATPAPGTKHVDEDRGIEQETHQRSRFLFSCRDLARVSLSLRTLHTHTAVPLASSGWSFSFQAGSFTTRLPFSRKWSNF